ncbi:hypothetical protein IWQ56_007219, partial [Coemansia nantahalensis]
RHLPGFLDAVSIEPIDFPCVGQPAMYLAMQFETDYNNNVSLRFGNLMRKAVDLLYIAQERAQNPTLAGVSNGRVLARVHAAAERAKEAVVLGRPGFDTLDDDAQRTLRLFKLVYNTYPADHVFEDGDLEADSQLHCEVHQRAFYVLARIIGSAGGRIPQCFPQGRSCIPSHVHIDTIILRQNILGSANCRGMTREQIWGQVVDLNLRAFKPATSAEDNLRRHFFGSIDTDGVAVSVIKMTKEAKSGQRVRKKLEEGQEARPKQHKRNKRKWPGGADNPPDDNSPAAAPRPREFQYIDDLSDEELDSTIDN